MFERLITGELDLGLHYELWPALQEGSRKTLIVLHGRGDSMEGYHWLPEALDIDALNFLFLNAPDPYDLGFSWYGVPPNQGPGIQRSRALLHGALDKLRAEGLKTTDLFLFGFSQGCLMSVDTGLRYPHPLGGIVGSSGYVFFMEEYPKAFSPYATAQRFMLTHGTQDELIPISRMKPSMQRLRELGLKIDWREYDKEHTVDMERELPDIRERLLVWIEGS